MSHNSYELKKQKIEAEAASELQKLRGLNYYSQEDFENQLTQCRWKCLASFVLGILIATIVLHFI